MIWETAYASAKISRELHHAVPSFMFLSLASFAYVLPAVTQCLALGLMFSFVSCTVTDAETKM